MENVLHFNLGPLLASAGVAGVAIGLTSQTIVKDMSTTILILVENQYNVGDVATEQGMTGTVIPSPSARPMSVDLTHLIYIIPQSARSPMAPTLEPGYSVVRTH